MTPVEKQDDLFKIPLKDNLDLFLGMYWLYQNIAYTAPFCAIYIRKQLISYKHGITGIRPHHAHGLLIILPGGLVCIFNIKGPDLSVKRIDTLPLVIREKIQVLSDG